jgi:hypothetical protein
VALERIVEVDQGLEMRPAQLSPQRGDSLLVGKCLREPHHVTQVLGGEAAPEVCRQLSRQRGDDLLAVAGAFAAEDLAMDPLTHLPVQPGQLGVDGRRGAPVRVGYQLPDVGDQTGGDGLYGGHTKPILPERSFRIMVSWGLASGAEGPAGARDSSRQGLTAEADAAVRHQGRRQVPSSSPSSAGNTAGRWRRTC